MKAVVVTSKQKHQAALLDEMFRFRKRVFHDELGWNVENRDGREIDEFDDLDPHYFLVEGGEGRVVATGRILPTTGPYMLEKVFPQLLCGEALPRDPAVWEISRLAVDVQGLAGPSKQASMSFATLELLRVGQLHGIANGIESYVFVTSVALERMLQHLGLHMRRLGDGNSQMVGKVRSVACWAECSQRQLAIIEEVLERLGKNTGGGLMAKNLSEEKSTVRISPSPRLLAVIENGRRGKKVLATYLGCDSQEGKDGAMDPRILYEYHRQVSGKGKDARKKEAKFLTENPEG